MIVFVVRIAYLVAVCVGLTMNFMEWRIAHRRYRFLTDVRVNGSRQLLANYFSREAFIRVMVQVFLLFPAVIGIYLTWYVHMPPTPSAYTGAVLLGQISHIGAVILLAAKSVMMRHDRKVIVNILQTDFETAETRRKQA